jgi:hypothetical protein
MTNMLLLREIVVYGYKSSNAYPQFVRLLRSGTPSLDQLNFYPQKSTTVGPTPTEPHFKDDTKQVPRPPNAAIIR